MPLSGPLAMVTGPSGILSLDGLVNPFLSSDPAEPTAFAETFSLDSTSLLRGLLRSGQTIRYAIATAGPVTVISHPETSRNAAVIRWASGANGKRTTIETEGLVMTLDAWVKVTDWGSTKRFQRYGTQPWIKWVEKRGRWLAVDLDRRVLAVLVSRKSALGTRLKLTSTGLQHADAVVLTALVTVSGPHDWRRYPAGANEPSLVPAAMRSEHALPSYGQAPFTRPLASLTNVPRGLLPRTRGVAHSVPNLALPLARPTPAPAPTNEPVVLTLDSRQLLSGVFSVGNRPEVVITTIGPYTTLARYVSTDDDGADVEDGRRLMSIASIEWVSSSFKGKRLTKVRMHGQKKILDEIVYSSSPFFEKRERRFGLPGFLPWMTWIEASSRAGSSLSLSSNSSSIQYTCRSHPDGRPLAVLSRRLTSAGTQLELTPEGYDNLDAVLLTGLLVVCGSHDWKRVAGIGVPANFSRSRQGRERAASIDEEDGMAVGEEMVTGLDGWASPPDLFEMSPGAGSGFLTPRALGSAMHTPVVSRPASPPPYA